MKDVPSDIAAFAQAMLDAAAASDYDALRAFYHPDARLWMNVTRCWKTLDEHIESAGQMRHRMKNLRYAEPRLTPFEGGYVQQFRACAETPEGGQVDIPACLIVHLKDGKILIREEYIDSAQLVA